MTLSISIKTCVFYVSLLKIDFIRIKINFSFFRIF